MDINNSPTIYLSDDDALWIEYQIETTDYTNRAQIVRDALEHFRECSETPVSGNMDDIDSALEHLFKSSATA